MRAAAGELVARDAGDRDTRRRRAGKERRTCQTELCHTLDCQTLIFFTVASHSAFSISSRNAAAFSSDSISSLQASSSQPRKQFWNVVMSSCESELEVSDMHELSAAFTSDHTELCHTDDWPQTEDCNSEQPNGRERTRPVSTPIVACATDQVGNEVRSWPSYLPDRALPHGRLAPDGGL